MTKERRATVLEKQQYDARQPVYPLWGFIKVDGQECPIEYTGEGPGNPNYEVMAPDGRHFVDGPLHSMLCADLKDLRERVSHAQLESCHCDD